MENKRAALFMIAPPTQGGGAEKYFTSLAGSLAAKGIGADLITFDDKSFRGFARLLHIFTRGNFFGKIEDYEKGMREKREDVERRLGKARWIESPRKKIGEILKNYDAVYAKNEIADLFVLKMIGYKNLPPVIVGAHTPLFYPEAESFFSKLHNFLYSGFVYKRLLRGIKRFHVSNNFTKNFAKRKYGIDARLIYYPFSPPADRNPEPDSRASFDSGKKNIIFAGRLAEQKGIGALLELIERFDSEKKLADRFCFNIFGCGDRGYENRIRKIAEKYPFVRYFGHAENKRMPQILARQDFMVAPSKWETLPYVVLEAQAAGLPVVAFDIPGPSDIILHGETGYLAKDKEDFFTAAKNIAEGKLIFEKEKIVRNIQEKFNPEKICGEMADLILGF